MENNILVTGSSGFIGKYLIDFILNKNNYEKIFLISRKNISGSIAMDSPFIKIHCDLKKKINFRLKVNTVIHIAAETRFKDSIYDVNYLGTKNLLNWSIKNKIKKFIFVSSVSVYGADNKSGKIDEMTKCLPKTLYGKSKSDAENLVINKCNDANIKYVIIRPTSVLGVMDNNRYPLLGLIKSIKNRYFFYFGEGLQYFNYISVEDLVYCIKYFIDNDFRNKIFILNDPITLKSAVNAIANKLDQPTPKIILPYWAGHLFGKMGDKIKNITKRAAPFDSDKFFELTNETFYDGNLITEETKFRYQYGIKSTLIEIINYYIKKRVL